MSDINEKRVDDKSFEDDINMKLSDEDLSDVAGGKVQVIDLRKVPLTLDLIKQAREQGPGKVRLTYSSNSDFK